MAQALHLLRKQQDRRAQVFAQSPENVAVVVHKLPNLFPPMYKCWKFNLFIMNSIIKASAIFFWEILEYFHQYKNCNQTV